MVFDRLNELNGRYIELDQRMEQPEVYTDAEAFSYRLDGNNVDVDRENVYMAQNQITYNSLMQCVKSEFQNLKTAMGNGG